MPKAEPESTPEPERAPLPEPENEPKGEPLPEWTTAIKTWGVAWPFHWIGYAVIFSAFLILAIILLRRLYRHKQQGKAMTNFSITVTTLVTICMASRLLYLAVNPYESPKDCLFGYGNCPLFMSRLLFSIGLPSLVSAFLLVHLALLDVMKLQQLSNFSKLRNWKFLVSVVGFNYFISITADLVVSYKAASIVFVIICQAYFVIFSAALVIGFSYTGISIYTKNKTTKSHIYKLSTKSKYMANGDQEKINNKSTRKVVRLTFLTAILGLAFLVSQLYSMVALLTASNDMAQSPSPWPWLTCQYTYRFIEIAMACCLLYNISYMPKQKIQYHSGENMKSKMVSASKYAASPSGSNIEDRADGTPRAPHYRVSTQL